MDDSSEKANHFKSLKIHYELPQNETHLTIFSPAFKKAFQKLFFVILAAHNVIKSRINALNFWHRRKLLLWQSFESLTPLQRLTICTVSKSNAIIELRAAANFFPILIKKFNHEKIKTTILFQYVKIMQNPAFETFTATCWLNVRLLTKPQRS